MVLVRLEISSSSCCCWHRFRCPLIRWVATDWWSVCSKRPKFNTTLLTGKILSSLLAPLEGDGWFWWTSTCHCLCFSDLLSFYFPESWSAQWGFGKMQFKVCEPTFTARTSMNHGIANTSYTWFASQVECWREVFGRQARTKIWMSRWLN
jgi:hypothetical protein